MQTAGGTSLTGDGSRTAGGTSPNDPEPNDATPNDRELNDATPSDAMRNDATPSDAKDVGRPSPPRRSRTLGILLAVAFVVVLLDQATKAIAVDRLADGQVVRVIDGWLQLRLVSNPGAAFGMATGYTIVLTALAAVVVVVILRMSRQLTSTAWAIALGAMLGGAVGNLADRVFRPPSPLRGHVIDWIQLPHWPVFNVADSSVVSAAVLIVLLTLRGIEYNRAPDR